MLSKQSLIKTGILAFGTFLLVGISTEAQAVVCTSWTYAANASGWLQYYCNGNPNFDFEFYYYPGFSDVEFSGGAVAVTIQSAPYDGDALVYFSNTLTNGSVSATVEMDSSGGVCEVNSISDGKFTDIAYPFNYSNEIFSFIASSDGSRASSAAPEINCSNGGNQTVLQFSNIVFTTSSTFNLSIGPITLNQPVDTPTPTDAYGNHILATTTSPTATPAPKQTAVKAEAQVTVDLTGTPPAGSTTTNLQLMLGGKVIAIQSIDLTQLQQGPNVIKLDFVPPTDPSTLGVLPLTATIGASSNSINVNTMVECTVAQAGRTVQFWPQGAPNGGSWSEQDYGIPALSSAKDPDMWNLGCSVTDLAMLFDSYGIHKTPMGSPAYPTATVPFNPPPGLDGEVLDPGTLDYAMANYRNNDLSKGSVGFDPHNNPIWAGAAEIARASDPSSAVSFKYMLPNFSEGPFQPGQNQVTAAIAGIQNDICSGNPVILKFSEPSNADRPNGGQHFMLTTGIVLDKKNKIQTLQLNNPGTSAGLNELYSNIQQNYPAITGGELFRPSADPMMMFITAPLNVHLVITDPQGRKTGYDPITNTSYSQIPGATYEVQSINTPNEVGYTPETLVAERYFVSSTNVLAGDYTVTIYGVSNGSYYVDYRGFDSTGTTNKSILASGTITVGQSKTMMITQTNEPAPVPNANLFVKDYSVWHSRKHGFNDAFVHVQGNIRSVANKELEFNSDFKLLIGGVGEYTFDLPLSSFESHRFFRHPLYEYHSKDADVMIEHNGDFMINIRHANLSNVNQSEMPLVTVEAGNLIGQKFTNLVCRNKKCSTRIEHDNDPDKDWSGDRDYFGHSYDHNERQENSNRSDESSGFGR